MAYNVSQDFTNKLYSGESNFRAILTIGENTIDNDQIASISISSPIIDDSKQVFYLGSFISQKITIKFKNMDGIDVHSGDNVDLSIGQYVNNEWVDVPIGKFLVDDLAEDYFEKCEFSCLDYAVKFKPNIDYSECFIEKIVDGKVVKSATIETILKYICNEVNVQLGSYPTINNDIEIGTYDSTVSGKQWISYIAEIKGCNAKMDRQGRLTLQPLKQSSNVPINALESASFELGEKYKISQVVYFDALRNYTFGNDKENTLYIRQENPFINDENVIKEIYKSIINEQRSETEATDFDLYNTDEFDLSANKMYGFTSQDTYTGKNLLNTLNFQNSTSNGITGTYDASTQTITFNGTCTSDNTTFPFYCPAMTFDGTYTLWFEVVSGTITNLTDNTRIQLQRSSDWSTFSVKLVQSGNASTRTWADVTTNNNNIRFDNGVVVNNFKIRVQIEKNSYKTSWERYVGGIPSPNPDYPQTINTVTGRNIVNITGKNLFNVSLYDGSDKTGGATVSNDGNTITFTSANTDSYTPSMWSETQFYDHRKMAMPVLPNTQYTFSFNVDSTPNGRIYIYEGDKNYQGVGQAGTIDYSSITKTITFTTSANTYYLIFRFVLWSSTTINISNIQLEKEEQTSYEPYKSQSYEIDLGKNLIDMATLIYGIYRVGDGTYVSSSNAKCTKNMMEIDNAKNYTLSIKSLNTTDYIYVLFYDANKTYLGNIAKKISSKELTLNTYANYLNAKYINIRIDDITFTELQLEEGSVATSYAPYYRVSNNLLNMNTVISGYSLNPWGDVSPETNSIVSDYIEVEPNTPYTYFNSYNDTQVSHYMKISEYTNDKTFIIRTLENTNKLIITTTSTTKYIRVSKEAFTTNDRLQVNEGNTTLPYEPYDKHIELCKIGEYQDYITKNTGKNLFDKDNDTLYMMAYINGSGVIKQDTVNGTIYIPCRPSTTYTVQKMVQPTLSGNRFKVGFVNTKPTIDTQLDWYYSEQGTNRTSYTFTTYDDTKYIVFNFYGNDNLVSLQQVIDSIQIEQGSTATDYEPYGKDEWYEYHNIGKSQLLNTFTWYASGTHTVKTLNQNTNINNIKDNYLTNNLGLYSNYFIGENASKLYRGTTLVGIGIDDQKSIFLSNNDWTVEQCKTFLQNNQVYMYYLFNTPDVRKITYQPLIDQLNAIEKMKSYEGKTYITSRGVEENSPIDIKYYINTDFELWSLKTHNYGDFTLDAWDNINYELGDKNYLTLNNNTINYEMTIMGDVTTKIPTKQQEVTTNVVGGDDSVNIKKIKTEVDNLNGTATILAEKTDNNSDQISQLRVAINAIQNLFTLTGGRNNVRNSAFLLTDEVWNFTNNGANPYHTTFGKSYDISLAGKTVSISEIKLQDTIAKTNSDNITGIKNDGTRYNLSFYYKQDADTTTTIKLYDTNNSSVKAFDDIIITGEKEFRSYNISFVPTSTNYTLEIVTSTTSSTGAFYLYDLMLNSGDRQPWSPAPDEVYSTTLTMSRLGLKVYSVGDGTITLLGSDGLVSYETTDGQTLGRLVSKRTVNGDLTKSNTSELIGLVPDIVAFEEGTDKRRWVDTSIELNGKLHKITYLETGE